MSDDLVTNLVADASQFNAGADQVSARAHELEHEMKHIASEIATSFGVGFGIERGVEAIKGQIEKITELSHLAERTGIDINEMRALQYEAKHAGVEFENLQNVIKKMQVNLGDASGGGKKASVFRELKLDAEALAAMDPAQAFAKIGDAIAAIENPTSRVHYAFELFGKTGAEALNVITEGSEGLKRAMEKVGIISPEDVEEVHKAHEAMLDLDAATQKLERSFAANLAPAITQITDALTEGVKKGTELFENLQSLFKMEIPLGKNAIGVFLNAIATGKPPSMADLMGALTGDKKFLYGNQDVITGPEDLARARAKQQAADAKKVAEADALRRAKEGNEADDRAKFNESQLARRQELIEKTYPEAKFGREITEGLDDLNDGVLDASELGDLLADAAKRFQQEMESRDPLKKLKEEAKHLLEEAEFPEDKFEAALTKAGEMYSKGVITKGQLFDIRDAQFEKLAREEGLGELIDGKKGFHAPTKIEGGAAITDQGEAYKAFFKGLQPSIDTEQAKQTALQNQMVALQKRANEIAEGVGRKITPPPTPLSLN
jgi:DNA-binding Xre family transcriptional regulator